jgi:drug/metabolite transporter (DMT)-like permease
LHALNALRRKWRGGCVRREGHVSSAHHAQLTAVPVAYRIGACERVKYVRKGRVGEMTAIDTTQHSRAWLGIAVALAAGAGYAVANTSASLAYQAGSNPMTVAATRFLIPVLALVVWLRMSGVSLVLPKRETVLAILLGFVTALYTYAFLRSFSILPFALAVLIFYLFPLIAAIMVVALGWEKFVWRTGAAIVLALIGLALALDVRGGNLDPAGIALALVGAVGLAIVIVVSSRMFRTGDARPVTLYMAAGASALLLVLCAASGEIALPHTASGWIGFTASSICYGFAMIAFFIAMSMIGPVRTSLFSYVDAVISAILGVVVLGQALTLIQVAGIVLVIGALVGATGRTAHS